MLPHAATSTILLVEDDLDIQALERSLLELEGFRVVMASNGQEAFDLLQFEHPSLILLDLMMPVMSGWEFLATHGEQLQQRRIPIVVLSADFEEHHPRETLRLAQALLRKPFHLEELISTIHLHKNCEVLRE